MKAYRSHRKDCKSGDIISGPVYAFTQRGIAEWYRNTYMNGEGVIIEIEGTNPRKHKDHPEQRIFDNAVVVKKLEGDD